MLLRERFVSPCALCYLTFFKPLVYAPQPDAGRRQDI